MFRTINRLKLISAIKTTLQYFIAVFFVLNVFANEAIGQASNNDDQWFQIEYIIFEHYQQDTHILRYEDIPSPSIEQKQFTYLTQNPNPLSVFQFTQLAQNKTELNDALERLKRSQLVSILDSGAWQQSLSAEKISPPLKIAKSLADGRELFGEIQLRKSRFTHAEFELFLTRNIRVPFANISDWFLDTNSKWRVIDLITPLSDESLVSPNDDNSSLIYTNTYYLKESRRIKDAEIHYIDHPVFSVIVTIKGITVPDILETYSGDSID